MSARQTLQKRSSIALDLCFIRIADSLLNPRFGNAAAFDLKFGVLIVLDHEAPRLDQGTLLSFPSLCQFTR